MIKNLNYDELYKWIGDGKAEADKLFKELKYTLSLDKYILALCGFDFEKFKLSKE